MISDQDVTKLKKTFVTKADLAKLSKTFATKVDLAKTDRKVDVLDRKMDALQEQVGDLTVEMGEVKERLDNLDTNVGRMANNLDLITGYIHELRDENRFDSIIFNRHERQIQALAAHTGATIPQD